VTFVVLEIAVKKANVGGPVKPALNSILTKIGQVNPDVVAARSRLLRIHSLAAAHAPGKEEGDCDE
jgi:hypothetical protein